MSLAHATKLLLRHQKEHEGMMVAEGGSDKKRLILSVTSNDPGNN